MKVDWTYISSVSCSHFLWCIRCCGSEPLKLPISAKELAKKVRRFNGLHGECLKIDPKAPAAAAVGGKA